MKRLILIVLLMLGLSKAYSQTEYQYMTNKYICHNRDQYGNWSYEQVGFTKILVVFDFNRNYIRFYKPDSDYFYFIQSSYKKNKYPITYNVYECIDSELGVPHTFVLTTNSESGSQAITLENVQTRVTYNVDFIKSK